MPPSLRDTSSTTLSGVDEPIIHGGKHRRHGSCRSSKGVGGSSWNRTTTEFSHGFLETLKRVLFSTFLAFKPSSESLKLDAAIIARHIVDDVIGGR